MSTNEHQSEGNISRQIDHSHPGEYDDLLNVRISLRDPLSGASSVNPRFPSEAFVGGVLSSLDLSGSYAGSRGIRSAPQVEIDTPEAKDLIYASNLSRVLKAKQKIHVRVQINGSEFSLVVELDSKWPSQTKSNTLMEPSKRANLAMATARRALTRSMRSALQLPSRIMRTADPTNGNTSNLKVALDAD